MKLHPIVKEKTSPLFGLGGNHGNSTNTNEDCIGLTCIDDQGKSRLIILVKFSGCVSFIHSRWKGCKTIKGT